MFNAKTGKNDGISTAYRIKMTAAYVVDPDKAMDIPGLAREEERKEAFEAIKANTVRGAELRVPQPVPPGTSEASFPSMEHYVADLPSRDYFLKTLDRPHYADEDSDGYPPWAPRYGAPAPVQQPKPQQQVRNDGAD
jgi:hypothetical protein